METNNILSQREKSQIRERPPINLSLPKNSDKEMGSLEKCVPILVLIDINNNWIESLIADISVYHKYLFAKLVWGFILADDHIKYGKKYIEMGNPLIINQYQSTFFSKVPWVVF